MGTKLLEDLGINVWDYNDFLAFVLMYAAFSDNVVLDDEIEAIDEKVGAKATANARTLMEKLDDMERIDVIVAFKTRFFADNDKQKALLKDIENIYKSDGDYSKVEKVTYQALEKIFKLAD